MTKRTGIRLGLLLGAAILLHAGKAWAPFHDVVIEEVFFGTEDCPDAQYVKLRTLSFGQTLVFGQRMRTQLADGTAADDFGRFTSNLNNSQAGVAMIMGTAAAAALFGMTFDEVVTGRLVQPDGRVCFALFGPPTAPVDCVAYGNYTGDNGAHGSPAVAPVAGMALVRQSETNDNAADFVLGAPNPENNDGDLGVLGQCPPAEATPTPSAPATPTSTVGISSCVGDCNLDFQVTVDEIVTGTSIALGMLPITICERFDAGGDGMVTVDEIVAAVDNGLNGCGGD
jgi:hypothetical protein